MGPPDNQAIPFIAKDNSTQSSFPEPSSTTAHHKLTGYSISPAEDLIVLMPLLFLTTKQSIYNNVYTQVCTEKHLLKVDESLLYVVRSLTWAKCVTYTKQIKHAKRGDSLEVGWGGVGGWAGDMGPLLYSCLTYPETLSSLTLLASS